MPTACLDGLAVPGAANWLKPVIRHLAINRRSRSSGTQLTLSNAIESLQNLYDARREIVYTELEGDIPSCSSGESFCSATDRVSPSVFLRRQRMRVLRQDVDLHSRIWTHQNEPQEQQKQTSKRVHLFASMFLEHSTSTATHY
jgi:hypothetical protein